MPKIHYCTSPTDMDRQIKNHPDFNSQSEGYEPQSNMSVGSWYWVAFYHIFTNFGVLDDDNFNQFQKGITCGLFHCITFDENCFVLGMPTDIHYNDDKLPHSVDGPAVRWGDEWEAYFVNGRPISKELFDKCKTLTREEFIGMSNAEDRSAAFEILGREKVMEILEAELIDELTINYDLQAEINESLTANDGKDADFLIKKALGPKFEVNTSPLTTDTKETWSLFKTKDTYADIDNTKFAWVKFDCPSTGHNYFISVNPEFDTAEAAGLSTMALFETLEDYTKNTDRT